MSLLVATRVAAKSKKLVAKDLYRCVLLKILLVATIIAAKRLNGRLLKGPLVAKRIAAKSYVSRQ